MPGTKESFIESSVGRATVTDSEPTGQERDGVLVQVGLGHASILGHAGRRVNFKLRM